MVAEIDVSHLEQRLVEVLSKAANDAFISISSDFRVFLKDTLNSLEAENVKLPVKALASDLDSEALILVQAGISESKIRNSSTAPVPKMIEGHPQNPSLTIEVCEQEPGIDFVEEPQQKSGKGLKQQMSFKEALDHYKSQHHDLDHQAEQVVKKCKSYKSKRSRQGHETKLGRAIDRFVQSQFFEGFCCVIIFLNFATIGAEAHYYVIENLPSVGSQVLIASEAIFTFFFVIEMALRIFVDGVEDYIPSLENLYNTCDLVLVLIGVITSWIIPLIELVSHNQIDKISFRILVVLRALRLFRFVGMLRRVEVLREMWLLVRGLAESLRILTSTITLIFFMVYAFAVFGMFFIAKPIQEEYAQAYGPSSDGNATESSHARLLNSSSGDPLSELYKWTAGIDKFMYFLMNILTGDEYYHVVRNIQDVVPLSWIYFYIYTAVLTLVLMNLITATIVETAFENSRKDEQSLVEAREAARIAELEDMKALFELMDENGDGTLSWEEFEQSFLEDEMAERWHLMDFTHDDCAALFKILDDGSGEIETKQFFDGLRNVRGGAKSKDVFQVIQMVEKLSKKIESLTHRQSKIDA